MKWFCVVCIFYTVAIRLEPVAKIGLSNATPLAASRHIERPASSSESKSFRELPARYRRKPIDDVEIEYIQVSRYLLMHCCWLVTCLASKWMSFYVLF